MKKGHLQKYFFKNNQEENFAYFFAFLHFFPFNLPFSEKLFVCLFTLEHGLQGAPQIKKKSW